MRRRTWMWPSITLLAIVGFVTAGVPRVLAGHGAKIQDDVNGSCPSGFSIVAVADHDKDKNANGIVCQASTSAKTKSGSGTEAAPKGKSGAASDSNQKKASQGSQPKAKQGKQIRIKDDISGVCPPNFTFVAGAAGYPTDENNNGVVCVKFE